MVKWVLFLISLLALFVANNALFLMPGEYSWFNAVSAAIAISIAAVLAWFSSKGFVKSASPSDAGWRRVVGAPPALVWIIVVLWFCALGVMKIIEKRAW